MRTCCKLGATFGHSVTVSMIQHTLCFSCTTVYQSTVQAKRLQGGLAGSL